MKTSHLIPKGKFAINASPVAYMDEGANELAFFVRGLYGLGKNTNFRVTAGFFETDNYIGGNLEWPIVKKKTQVSLSLGGHYVNDPAVDLTLNLSTPLSRYVTLYTGVDTDLIMDDDPDLPIWGFLGLSYKVINQVDVMVEFNVGTVEIAPHVLASGFVFYF